MMKTAKEAKRLTGFRVPEHYGEAMFSGRYVTGGYVLEKYLIPGGGDYMLPAALFMPVGERNNEVVLLLNENGMEHAVVKDSLMIHSMLKQGFSVLLFDVRGIGALGPGYLKGDAYIDNTSYNQWFASILTNKSIVGMRAEDILRIVHFIEGDISEFETISALASGACGSELLHAAVFDRSIQKVGLVQPFMSFADIVLNRDYAAAFIPSTVAGAIEKYDLPDLMAALSPRNLLIINPLSENGELAGDDQKSCRLSYPRIVYNQKGVEDNFKYAVVNDGLPVNKQIIEWLTQ